MNSQSNKSLFGEGQFLKVGIIGRPNVGKSTLFNVLTRTRKSVVRNEAGVTRDFIVELTEWWGKKFQVIDTGGLTEASDIFSQMIRSKILDIINSFDLLILVFDGKSGMVPEDREVVKLAKSTGKPVLLVVNKVDQFHKADLVLSEFYEFGMDVIPCSFESREGVDQLVEWILGYSKVSAPEIPIDLTLTIVGKPNVGKSSLCNKLLRKDRMMVSDIAGTTVDAVENRFQYEDKTYNIVDTAGLRRQSKRDEGIESIAAIKSHSAINKADVVLLLVDALSGPTVQDAKMVEYILSQHKPFILVCNKWDLGKEKIPSFKSWFKQKVQDVFHFYPDIPVVFISAKTGSGIPELFSKMNWLWERVNIHIKTSQLNQFFFDVIRKAPAPVHGTKNVKLYYLTQTQQRPPSFIAFANHPESVTPAYKRFLSKQIQREFDLPGVPIRIYCMKKGSGKSQKAQIILESDSDLQQEESNMEYVTEWPQFVSDLSYDDEARREDQEQKRDGELY